MTPAKKKENFESRLDGLVKLVEGLESGELSLEQSVEKFSKGVQLVQELQKNLSSLEQKVEDLSDTLKQSLLEIEDDSLDDDQE
ncbi:MAG TPA: exodeoxyribonuclease VII small subunit [Planctomycetota bacterium]|jgi:exodeoxyribonuclease VII small subunit|nr:exodeoxyribonuclease VII small subunit [Planctomycetota bacterium]MDP6128088.1 exodeoxyribonuclease VII small subunit [Planctomycetota bacterium]MDP7245588.1 exodeoxyribonuclease VII small subunit [Planctomycetota bacterium]MDP7559633.1 exodeoxyribonuclease VII small subunit [Planctomycetota bacterium]HJM39572.1 exodeoxyribonuclease VII small subunit [Planctomycetota bacterium]|tara:strand:+ start:47628 stop:47879 length:252 start_codon:yes stop_codon:yes gene_type:complete